MYDLKVWTDESEDVSRSGKTADSERTRALNKVSPSTTSPSYEC